MFGRHTRLAALGASALGALMLAGCGASNGVDTAPPATLDRSEAKAGPDLLGAPPPPNAAAAPDGLLGAPVAAPRPVTVAPAGTTSRKTSNLKTWRRPDGTLVTAMRPIPNPKVQAARHVVRARTVTSAPAAKPIAHAVAKPAVIKPVAKPAVIAAAPKPKVVAAAPAPKAVVATPALKPVAPPVAVPVLAKAPTPTIPAAVPPLSKIDKLQAAVAPEATKGAVLAAGESLGKGEAGQVTLSLPATLGDLIKAEAAKLGLTKAAKKTSAYANLEGEGYEVTPNGKQTAVVKAGEPTTFAWQVKPGAEAKGQLKSEYGVELNGAKKSESFSLGEIVKRVTPLPAKAEESANGLLARLNLPGLNGKVNLPGLGETPIKSLLGGALVLLAVIILAIISRNAAASKAAAERRRKFRTLTDYGRNEMELDGGVAPSSAHVSYVSPMVAAAAAATAAAVAVSHDHHDEPAPATDHGHGAPVDHAPEAHAADDHGHGADLHAGAQPDPHAPAEHVGYVNPMVASTQPVTLDDHGHADHGHDAPAAAHDEHAHEPTKPDHGPDHGHESHHAKELEPAH